MKFYELYFLFTKEMNKAKKAYNNLPSQKYIMTAYNNVLKKLSTTYNDSTIVTDDKIYMLDITNHMKEKLIDISYTKLSKAAVEKIKVGHVTQKLKSELTNLLGIGEKKADDLIAEGLRSISQLRLKKWNEKLNLDTQIILKHEPEYIKYAEISAIGHKLTTDFSSKNIMIVGSYRRNKPVMKDIDILFLANKSQKIDDYIAYLKATFKNNIWIYANGPDKISFIIKSGNKKYKADIFIATPDNYYAMLLYTTGSRQHNINMRARARSLGYILNQNGIFDRKSGKKINRATDNEKKLFSILSMQYLLPPQR
jgi:DNA polymerase/3'-5' exonuclease PolX